MLFVTNNSTKSRGSYVQKFQRLGLHCSIEEVFGSAYAAAYYLRHVLRFPADRRVYVVGQQGIRDELDAEGVVHCGGEEDRENMAFGAWNTIQTDALVGAVLVGFDVDINYRKIARAFTLLHSNADCLFLATNNDLTYPANGTVYPGTGALLASISTPLGRQPILCGKPTKTMLDCIVRKYHLNPARTVMVGDRLDTDIAFGQLGGFKTLLVLSGKCLTMALLSGAPSTLTLALVNESRDDCFFCAGTKVPLDFDYDSF